MEIRDQLNAQLDQFLSPFATRNAGDHRRAAPFPESGEFRTDFQRDRDRIIHCKAFRRLEGKTQVFLAPEGDHFRTRLTHTLEVTQVARTLARCLGLNEDLTEAIALGHDLGHTPFGHIGERTLASVMPDGFDHAEQSLRVVDVLEREGRGLNLTWEVRNGIVSHSGDRRSATLEGECVRKADRIAYLNHDLDDALRAQVLRPFDLPADCIRVLGASHGERIETMVRDIVDHSRNQSELSMSNEVESAMNGLREFMFERVYRDSWRAAQEEKCDFILRRMFEHYLSHPADMPQEFLLIGYREGMERAVCDFLSGMTDRYAIRLFNQLFVPTGFPVA